MKLLPRSPDDNRSKNRDIQIYDKWSYKIISNLCISNHNPLIVLHEGDYCKKKFRGNRDDGSPVKSWNRLERYPTRASADRTRAECLPGSRLALGVHGVRENFISFEHLLPLRTTSLCELVSRHTSSICRGESDREQPSNRNLDRSPS